MSTTEVMRRSGVACALVLAFLSLLATGAQAAAPQMVSPPQISGTAQDGSMLTVLDGSWTSDTAIALTVQWEQCDGSGLNCAAISGATQGTYTPVAADVGHELVAVETATDTNGLTDSEPSAAVGPVAAPAPPSPNGTPVISGSPTVGGQLSADPGSWTSPDTLAFSEQWSDCSTPSPTLCAPIPGATVATYSPQPSDAGEWLAVTVTATDAEGQLGSSTAITSSSATVPPPANSGRPTISGQPADGETLTASPGAWSSPLRVVYSYQWQRCAADGTACADVSGATASTYPLTSGDVGAAIGVTVTATDAEGQTGLTSASPTMAVAAPPPPSSTAAPTVAGTPVLGGQLSVASSGTWTSPDVLSYTYGWQRCDPTAGSCATISGASASTYMPGPADLGQNLVLTVAAVDQEGQSGPSTSLPVGPATYPAPVFTQQPSFTGSPADGQPLRGSIGAWSSAVSVTAALAWQRCDASGTNCASILKATSQAYRLSSSDVGHTVRLLVTAGSPQTLPAHGLSPASSVVAAPPPPVILHLPTISGMARVGSVLTAHPGTWVSPDPLSVAYVWSRCDTTGGACVPIRNAVRSTYTLAVADDQHTIRLTATATDREGQHGTATSLPTGTVWPQPPLNTRLPAISGTLQAGQALVTSLGAWTSAEALSYAYRWQRCDATGASCADLPSVTANTDVLTPDDLGHTLRVLVTATDPEAQTATASSPPVGPIVDHPPTADLGIQKIKHVVVIMQENRSFDSYFGTYPGADGIPGLGGNPGSVPCSPDPLYGGCVAPFHDTADNNFGGPHGSGAATADISHGNMNGFITEAESGLHCNTTSTPDCTQCPTGQQTTLCVDAMGYHTGTDIPNYWNYAHNFVLQDHMFASTANWSQPEHLYLVSGWAASCSAATNPFSCSSQNTTSQATTHAWTDLTYLLYTHGVSWGYYLFQGAEPDCESDSSMTCAPVAQSPQTPGIWNPLPNFTDVNQDNQLGNIQTVTNFYAAAKAGTLPAVSWVIPSWTVSEHPLAKVSNGQAYVTTLINAIMQSPNWDSTAIFLSWDEWGGFYDHVMPPTVDAAGYGLRVPGLLISPYAKQGYIDPQVLSHDAYMKFIEDDFLGGQRLDPATDGRPDPRPDVRETNPMLGDLSSEFDFTQPPRPPVLLPPCPASDLTPAPSC